MHASISALLCCPQVYVTEGRILPWTEVSWLSCEEYLGGLMDFTGA